LPWLLAVAETLAAQVLEQARWLLAAVDLLATQVLAEAAVAILEFS
jgi:hypothetical protein